jgi:two-component system alkaline phosphatase synthesis response regulator PhoP
MIRVFVIDDNPVHAKLAAKMVQKVDENVSLSVFNDPFLALTEAIQEPPDLLVLDMMMPKMDGIQLLRELRKEGIMTRAIIVSAFLERVSEKLLPSNNVAGVIGKPYTVEAFSQEVGKALKACNANGLRS